jgi:uncharacterized protein YdeI (YjbR/CyaY-like superfamily)
MPHDDVDPEVIFFANAAEFGAWLEANHETATELWMGIYRKADPRHGLSWEDAVVEALCFGWIDSTMRPMDDGARRQRWTPRKPTSNWSAVNIAHVERLLAEGRMRPAGIVAFERRPASRGYSYEDVHELTDAEASALASDPAALAFWEAATPGYRRICASWLHGAKREQTRADRLAALISDCAGGRLIPSQRYGETPAWVARAAAAAAGSPVAD